MMMELTRAQKGHAGEKLVGCVVAGFGAIYRHQPEQDIGIDGEIEFRDGKRRACGLLKVQVKTYRQKAVPVHRRHVEYWSSLPLPVLVCRASLTKHAVYWKLASEIVIESGKDSATVSIDRKLDGDDMFELRRLAEQNFRFRQTGFGPEWIPPDSKEVAFAGQNLRRLLEGQTLEAVMKSGPSDRKIWVILQEPFALSAAQPAAAGDLLEHSVLALEKLGSRTGATRVTVVLHPASTLTFTAIDRKSEKRMAVIAPKLQIKNTHPGERIPVIVSTALFDLIVGEGLNKMIEDLKDKQSGATQTPLTEAPQFIRDMFRTLCDQGILEKFQTTDGVQAVRVKAVH